jgi:hypothetical protein
VTKVLLENAEILQQAQVLAMRAVTDDDDTSMHDVVDLVQPKGGGHDEGQFDADTSKGRIPPIGIVYCDWTLKGPVGCAQFGCLGWYHLVLGSQGHRQQRRAAPRHPHNKNNLTTVI